MRVVIACLTLALSAVAQDHADLAALDRIKAEAFDRSKVMDHLYYLTEVHGPRLTASPHFQRASQWAMDRLKGYGLVNVHTEPFPFGRSWSLKQASVEMIEPRYLMLDATPLAWSSSSKGAVTGEPMLAVFRPSFEKGPKKIKEEFQAYQSQWGGKLRGKIVLISAVKPPKPQTKEQFRRYTDADLANLSKAPDPSTKSTAKKLEELEWPEDAEDLGKFFGSLPSSLMDEVYQLYDDLATARGAFFAKEGVAAVLTADGRAHEGMVFAEAAGAYKTSSPMAPPTFVVTAEQYDMVARAVQKKQPMQLRINLDANVSATPVDAWNIVGEIPGGAKKDEVVMIGAHFDSWHAGTGATDNGAGSAVMIEVTRILKALNLKLDRTVRIALWGGEEQGLLGSKAYVKEHFSNGSPKVSGYFNLDNGSGKIRGVYLQGNDAMRPVFEQWLAPFRDEGATTISIRNTGGTDHLSFDEAGIPGFQFIQDPLDYTTITHHSSMDTYDHAVAEDLMQASAVIAYCVYEAANRTDMLPRRPR